MGSISASHQTHTYEATAQAEHVAAANHYASISNIQNDMTSALCNGSMNSDSPRISPIISQRSDSRSRLQGTVVQQPSASYQPTSSPRRDLVGLIELVENRSQLVIQRFVSFAETREAVKTGFNHHVVESPLLSSRDSTEGEHMEANSPRCQYVPYKWTQKAIRKVDEESQILQDAIQDLLQSVGELSGVAVSISPETSGSLHWQGRDENWSKDLSSILFPEPLPDGVRYAEDFGTIIAALDEMSPRADASPVTSTLDSIVEEEHPYFRRLIDLHVARGKVQDQLMSSFDSEAEESASRDLMRDQGQKLVISDKAFRKRFSRARATLTQQIQLINAQIGEQEAMCLADGLDPAMLIRQTQFDDVFVDETGEHQSRSTSSAGRTGSDMHAKVEAWRDGVMKLP